MTESKDKAAKHQSWSGTPIVAVRSDGSVAGYFENPKAAIRNAGVCDGNLYQSLNGRRRITNGFMWMKASDYMATIMEHGQQALQYERPEDVYTGKGRKGFRPGHKGFNTWKNTPKDSPRRQQSRDRIRKAHERIRELCAMGKFHPRAKKVKCIDTGEIFSSMSEAAAHAGVSLPTMSNAIKNCKRTGDKYYQII